MSPRPGGREAAGARPRRWISSEASSASISRRSAPENLAAFRVLDEIAKLRKLDLTDIHPGVVFEPTAPIVASRAVSAPLWAQPIEELGPRIRAKALSPSRSPRPVSTASHSRRQAEELHLHAPDALEQARRRGEIKRGDWRGPLHGVPVAVKDNYLTADMPTTAGTEAPGIAFPLRDSAAAARLRAAGAVLIGKTRTHEFAWGNVTPPVAQPLGSRPRAVGLERRLGRRGRGGLVPAAMGSDTGGSIRMPAAVCGMVGLKPTFGRVSRDGIVPHSWSLDHAGPLTRTVADAAMC